MWTVALREGHTQNYKYYPEGTDLVRAPRVSIRVKILQFRSYRFESLGQGSPQVRVAAICFAL